MPTSGIKISDEVVKTFEVLKVNSVKSVSVKYMVLSFSKDGSKLEIESSPRVTDPEILTFDQLVESLPKDDVRFIVYSFSCKPNDAIVLITWCGAETTIRKRMLLSTTTNTLKTSLDISKHVHSESASELTKEIVLKAVGGTELSENP